MLTEQDILNAAEPGNILQGSVLATLQSKLLSGAVGVLFSLLGKLGDKDAINGAAAYLGSALYQLYRHLYRAAGTRYAQALRARASQKVKPPFPDLSAQAVKEAYPGQCQSLTQVLSTADARLSGLHHLER